MNRRYVITELDGMFQRVIVDDLGYTRRVWLRHDGGYYTKIYIDGNSRVTIEYAHAIGRGTVKIPNGEIYDLLMSLQVLEKLGIDKQAKYRIFEVVDGNQ